jgi:hypothetical protein
MPLSATVKLDLDAMKRASIEERMQAAAGSYIESLIQGNDKKIDFSAWTPQEFQTFIATMFDVAAVEVFKTRIVIVPPVEEVPY